MRRPNLQSLSPSILGSWEGFWRGKGRQDCTFILIQTKGPTLNSFRFSLSRSLNAAVVGFPAVHRDAARGATSTWPGVSVTAPTHRHVPITRVPSQVRDTRVCQITPKHSPCHSAAHFCLEAASVCEAVVSSPKHPIHSCGLGTWKPIFKTQSCKLCTQGAFPHISNTNSARRSAWLQAQIHFQMTCYEVH